MYSLRIGKNARNTLFSVCVCVCAAFSSLNNMWHTHSSFAEAKIMQIFLMQKNNPRQGFKKERIATLFASNSLSLHEKYFRI